ncbi:MAG TPA: helix-turn-helix transcriptional regulator, partial [Luteimonas sp.]
MGMAKPGGQSSGPALPSHRPDKPTLAFTARSRRMVADMPANKPSDAEYAPSPNLVRSRSRAALFEAGSHSIWISPMLRSSIRIRRARTLAGLTQTALAARLGVQRTAVTQWECERGTSPSVEHLSQIAR